MFHGCTTVVRSLKVRRKKRGGLFFVACFVVFFVAVFCSFFFVFVAVLQLIFFNFVFCSFFCSLYILLYIIYNTSSTNFATKLQISVFFLYFFFVFYKNSYENVFCSYEKTTILFSLNNIKLRTKSEERSRYIVPFTCPFTGLILRHTHVHRFWLVSYWFRDDLCLWSVFLRFIHTDVPCVARGLFLCLSSPLSPGPVSPALSSYLSLSLSHYQCALLILARYVLKCYL